MLQQFRVRSLGLHILSSLWHYGFCYWLLLCGLLLCNRCLGGFFLSLFGLGLPATLLGSRLGLLCRLFFGLCLHRGVTKQRRSFCLFPLSLGIQVLTIVTFHGVDLICIFLGNTCTLTL